MKFVPLLWSNLMRRKVRTICTGLSIFVAFLLMGALMSIRAGFARRRPHGRRSARRESQELLQPADAAGAPRSTGRDSRHRRCQPYRLVPGIYQDPRNDFPKLAVDGATWFDMHRDLWTVPDEQLARWRADRTGAIVGRDLANRFGWTIGSRMPIRGTMWPKRGGGAWEFTVDGIYQAGQPAEGMRRST